ncbi:hypothetical protein GTZ78_33465 [Streptomyces sp. SID8361]|uniref:hypothetical protein n=1 Tax=Streptomyces TaxID=1883 RepID=UPI00114D183F|nr:MULTISPECIES: hypothetical protein [Streptomyces]MYU15465.1 hypothetical protein [Streptomyces sp. SID8361]WHX18432.1 hypothetical protein QFW82_15935 [Streptomyces sp. NA07423]
MTQYTIVPNEGLDSIRFGESRTGLRERLGSFTSFQRGDSENPTDHFTEKGLLLSFDSGEALEFIEVTPEAQVTHQGIALFGRPYRHVLGDLREQGIEGTEDDQGVEFTELGFALFTPAPDDPDEEVHGVSVFPRGYYSI